MIATETQRHRRIQKAVGSRLNLTATAFCLLLTAFLLSVPLCLRWLIKAEPRGDSLLHARVVAEALDPLDARLAPKPCELSLGVVAHVEFGLLDGALKRPLAAEVFDDASVAVRAERARRGGHAAREESADFLDESGAEVRLGSHVDASVEFCARRTQSEDAQAR